MSVKTELAKYGSGIGYIYLTDLNDVITAQRINNKEGREDLERLMLISSSLSSNISATSVVTVTASGGDITNLSYNGVSVFNVASPVTGATEEDLATNLATAINAYISVPEYTAVSSGSSVTIYLSAEEGSSLNGSTPAFATTGAASMTATDLDGGAYPSGEVDSQVGFKMYLNASVNAPLDSIVGATDVTSGVIRKPASSPYSVRDVEISSGSISVVRDGGVTVVNVQTEGAVAASDLTSIDAGIFSEGDTLVIRGKEAAKVTTIKEGGNIELANSADFVTGNKDFTIVLQYSVSDNKWYEVNRSPGNDLNVASLRSSGIAVPVQGVQISSITLTGGSTVITAGTDKGYWVLVGSGSLTGNVTYSLASGSVEGDTIIIRMSGGITLDGNSMNLGGVSLTDNQASKGVVVKNVWDGSSWIPTVVPSGNGIDYADLSDLATKEDYLGLPSTDGQILSSTASGVRSWIPNSSDIGLSSNANTNSGAAGVETVLRTINIPAGTLSSNGSFISIKFVGSFGANANSKTLKVKFNGNDILQNFINTTPNGNDFTGEVLINRSNNITVKIGSTLLMNGSDNEVNFSQQGSLNLDTTSYDVEITGQGVSSSDVNIYSSVATKVIF